MNVVPPGQFYGQTDMRVNFEDCIITETDYTVPFVDWHYHEQVYFTFLLKGSIIEGNKSAEQKCVPGTLLFHNWQEPHYNSSPAKDTRGFHLELGAEWLKKYDFELEMVAGSFALNHPEIKLAFYQLVQEIRIDQQHAETTVANIVGQILPSLHRIIPQATVAIPTWVNGVKERLHDDWQSDYSLIELAEAAGVHPIYFSRIFSKYFGCNFGKYRRKVRIQKALSQLADSSMSLTEIAFYCGFSDQSHFIRSFKATLGCTPSHYRKSTLFSK